MKKHEINIDMISNSLVFWPGHCIHIRAISAIILSQSRLPTKIAVARMKKDITP